MFRGRYPHALDAKGRLALPSAFRRQLSASGDAELVITPHFSDPCLVAYPQAEWGAFEERFRALPQFKPKVMLMRRLYVGGAMDCPIDKQGRVLLPPVLRSHAGLEREAIWVGGLNTMEIWAPSGFESHVEAQRPKLDATDLAELGELGL